MSYEKLEQRYKKIHDLSYVDAIFSWDTLVNLPSGSVKARADSSASLSAIIHSLKTDPSIDEMVKNIDRSLLTADQNANLQEIERNRKIDAALSEDFVEGMQKACIESEAAWAKLKTEDKYDEYLPYFEKVLDYVKESADIYSRVTGLSPYDSLLDRFERGVGTSQIDPVFDKLKSKLPSLIDKAIEKQSHAQLVALSGPFSISAQQQVGRKVMEIMGFDMQRGRLDVSNHPFCGGSVDDVRITTRYIEEDFFESLLGVIHETGHALYELGLDERWKKQPIGGSMGMATHESQSLFWEMQIGRSREFLECITPVLVEAFEKTGDKAFSTENLFGHATKVERSYIRVGADELTYPLHIILRYEIEKELICGGLTLKDLPMRWQEKTHEYLGLDIKEKHSLGCMQDCHWPSGAFGYFPSYSLGAIIASQWKNAMEEAIGGTDKLIKSGDFTKMHEWMSKNVYSSGRRKSIVQLLDEVTGSRIKVDSYLTYLESRYL